MNRPLEGESAPLASMKILLCRLLVAGALLLTVRSAIVVYPHQLAFFNCLSGGSANGYTHLSSSNLDWGQGLLLMNEWAAVHPQNRPLFVEYYGPCSPESLGIRGTRRLSDLGPAGSQCRFPGGWYVISANYVQAAEVPLTGRPAEYPNELLEELLPHLTYCRSFGHAMNLYILRPDGDCSDSESKLPQDDAVRQSG